VSAHDIIRAWKDPAYRNRLSAAQRAALPANPAGAVEISAEDLGSIAGGRPRMTAFCPTISDCTCVPTWWVCCQ
jgi:mersacidin/lichenicidin family type 2 lantibiotic